MQQLNPKDRPKLIALVAGVVLVLGFGIKTTVDTMESVNTPGPVPSPGADTTQVTPEPSAAATTSEAPTDAYVLRESTIGGVRGRDPFTPVSDAEFAKYSVKLPILATPAPPIVTGNTNVFGRNTFKALRNGINNLNEKNKTLDAIDSDLRNVAATPPPPVLKVLPPPPPPYTVIGVLIGEPGGRDVAILSRTAGTDKSTGSSDKKFVVAGDPLEGGYTVSAIESGGVRVTHPGRRTTSAVPGATPVPIGGGTEYYLPKQTTVVPATSMTIPLEVPSKSNAPGAK